MEEADQLTDCVVTVPWMAKGKLVVDLVPVAASGACLGQVAGFLEIPDQLRGGSFGHADGLRDVSKACAGVGGDAHEHVRVVGNEVPHMIAITGNCIHR